MLTPKQIGSLGENIALNYLKKHNYIILDQNWHSRFGEIDIIAKKNNKIFFIEVKARTSDAYGQPQESVNYFKQRKLVKTAYCYLNNYYQDNDFQIDVIALNLNLSTRKAKLKHFQNAVGEIY